MSTTLSAVLLMSFLLWSYKHINKSFNVDVNNSAIASKPVIRLGVILGLFLVCYTFVWFTNHIANNSRYASQNYSQSMAPNSQNAKPKVKPNDNEIKPIGPDKTKGIKVIHPEALATKFTDIAGLNEAKTEVQDIISFLRNPEDFSRLGAKSPKGVLLYGEPGTGKTLLARAIAGESNVTFIAVSGSEFDEEFVGVGAARVRYLFARDNAPCIIFIDEIDALAHKRHAHDPAWSAQTVNQLLSEMDGLDNYKNQGIVVIGASNRVNAMDPAILRPGRLDRHIKLDVPTLSERTEVLNLYLSKIKPNANLKAINIAKMTQGFSAA